VLARECEVGIWVFLPGATRAWAGSPFCKDRRRHGAANKRKVTPPHTSVVDSIDYNLHLLASCSTNYQIPISSLLLQTEYHHFFFEIDARARGRGQYYHHLDNPLSLGLLKSTTS
jgi:hypothetical protein